MEEVAAVAATAGEEHAAEAHLSSTVIDSSTSSWSSSDESESCVEVEPEDPEARAEVERMMQRLREQLQQAFGQVKKEQVEATPAPAPAQGRAHNRIKLPLSEVRPWPKALLRAVRLICR